MAHVAIPPVCGFPAKIPAHAPKAAFWLPAWYAFSMAQLGRYELLKPIARGGMATVCLARVSGEGGFERLVAIKVMHPHICDDQEFVAMFLDEARIAARIRHPNVVSTLDVDRSPDGLFLVMEYVEGDSLHTVLRHAARHRLALPLNVAARIGIDMLEGLHAAHELKDEAGVGLQIIHRDVSPQNVLIGSDGVSRITDFGVAQARSRLATTQGAGLKGKVAYLSPEQIRGEHLDRRADIFAASIVLWELFSGRRLFRGQSEGETLAAILDGRITPLNEVQPAISEKLAQVVGRGLSASRDDRYDTAVAMADAVESAVREVCGGAANARSVATWLGSLEIPEQETGTLPSTGSTVGSMMLGERSAGPLVASTRPPEKRSRVPYFVGGALALGIAAGVVAYARAPSVASSGASSAAPLDTQVPQPEPSAAAAVAPAASASAAVPPAPSASVSPPPDASASSAPQVAAPPSQGHAAPAPRPTPRPKPGGATSFRPEGL